MLVQFKITIRDEHTRCEVACAKLLRVVRESDFTTALFEAETLAHVVSLEEDASKIASKPEPSTQMGMHLDSTLTLQTKKRYISRMPTDPESVRTKYIVMTNLWLLAQLRQPGRQLCAEPQNGYLKRFSRGIIVDRYVLYEETNRRRDSGCTHLVSLYGI